ncbi:hypothetical protein EJ06DRAFT_63332 [Trichodelitschia bisporula]|uniref:Uncharacterized protein n=1 Tax=Trichodelitschia bisporula TaxID=703511 RepID=A0A6G1HVG1_9PEZI|nr:hypothetical protein EJ06DRAFT_63332 [Trichodelitschia bisporula]
MMWRGCRMPPPSIVSSCITSRSVSLLPVSVSARDCLLQLSCFIVSLARRHSCFIFLYSTSCPHNTLDSSVYVNEQKPLFHLFSASPVQQLAIVMCHTGSTRSWRQILGTRISCGVRGRSRFGGRGSVLVSREVVSVIRLASEGEPVLWTKPRWVRVRTWVRVGSAGA